jgi:hypothetical protein
LQFTEAVEAAARRKAKAESKAAERAQSISQAAERTRQVLAKQQALRSSIFAAAKKGDAEAVKKGIYEDEVDAAGPEMLPGSDSKEAMKGANALETLLHIVVDNGDTKLAEWLLDHSQFHLFIFAEISDSNHPLAHRRRTRRTRLPQPYPLPPRSDSRLNPIHILLRLSLRTFLRRIEACPIRS